MSDLGKADDDIDAAGDEAHDAAGDDSAADEEDVEPQVEVFQCSVCEEDLPLSAYPTRNGKRVGAVCDSDQLAIEALQRQYKQDWGKDLYPRKWKNFKKDKDNFKQTVLAFRMSNMSRSGRGVRKIKSNAMVLKQSKVSRASKVHRRKRKPMTLTRWLEYSMSVRGGSHTKQQALNEWRSFGTKGKKSDNKGKFQGQRDQLRYHIEVSSSSASESASEDLRAADITSKPQKKVKAKDVEDFLDRDATLDPDGNVASAGEGEAETPLKKQRVISKPQDSPMSSPNGKASSSAGWSRLGAEQPEAREQCKRPPSVCPVPPVPKKSGKPWNRQMAIEKARNAWNSAVANMKLSVQKSIDLCHEVERSYLMVPEGTVRDVDRVKPYQRSINIMDQTLEFAEAWIKDTGDLTKFQFREDIDLYPGWLDVRARAELEAGLDDLDGCDSPDALKTLKANQATDKKAVIKMASHLTQAVHEVKKVFESEVKRDSAQFKDKASKKGMASKAAVADVEDKQPTPQVFLHSGASIALVTLDAVQLTAATVTQALADRQFCHTKPFVINVPKAAASLATDQRFNKKLSDFKADFISSALFKQSGRAQQAQDNLLIAAKLLSTILQVKVDLHAWLPHIDPSHHDLCTKFLAPVAVHLQGMASSRHFSGVDWNGFGNVRLQVEGQKMLVLVPFQVALDISWQARFKEGEAGGPPPAKPTSTFNLEAIYNELLGLDAAWAGKLLKAEGVVTATLVSAHMLWVPPGFLCLERCLSNNAYSVRKVAQPASLEHLEAILWMNKYNKDKMPTPVSLFGIAACKVFGWTIPTALEPKQPEVSALAADAQEGGAEGVKEGVKEGAEGHAAEGEDAQSEAEEVKGTNADGPKEESAEKPKE